MTRIRRILDQSDGKLNMKTLARDIQKPHATVREWLSMFRGTPNAESTLQLARWADSKEKKHARTGKIR